MFQDIYKNCQTWRWYKVIEQEKDAAADKTENKNENNENNETKITSDIKVNESDMIVLLPRETG